jgi:hypothetical protein
MIDRVMPVRRLVVGLVSAALVATLAPTRAHAQSEQDGWFEDGSGGPPPQGPPAPPPDPPPAPPQTEPPAPAPPQGVPAAPNTPAAPAAPAAPNYPAEPQSLAPSPLIDARQAPVPAASDQDPRALSTWNSYVDPYGTWVDDPRYGRVWIPNANVVGNDFAPYSTGGHWSLDENNAWVWMSDYPFGWVTFHYGRWVWIAGRGWAWIPGMQYAPAWVTWRVPTGSYDYVGWAPLPPSYVWFGGGAVWYGYAPLYPWVFCPSAYVFSYHVHSYVVYDHASIGYAAHNTRPYYVATPHPVASPAGTQVPHGPTPQAAHVPASSVPVQRVSSQSIAARGSASIATASMTRANVGSSWSAASYTQHSAVGGMSPTTRTSMSNAYGGGRPPVDMSSRSAPAYRPSSAQTFRSSPAPLTTYRPSATQTYRPPQFTPDRASVAPRPMSAPHFDAGHAVRSAPSFSGGHSFSGGGHSFGGGGHGHH